MISRFFDAHQMGIDNLGRPVWDRNYQASDHARFYEHFFVEAGVYMHHDSEACLVTVEGAAPFYVLRINKGIIFIKGYQGECEGDDIFPVSALPDGKYRVIVQLNIDEKVRRFVPEIRFGGNDYPELIRQGNIHEVSLMNLTMESGVPIETVDTRHDEELCGQLKSALAMPLPARPTFYPPTTIPELLWLYTIYPEALTKEQITFVEENPDLLKSYENSRIYKTLSLQDTIPTILDDALLKINSKISEIPQGGCAIVDRDINHWQEAITQSNPNGYGSATMYRVHMSGGAMGSVSRQAVTVFSDWPGARFYHRTVINTLGTVTFAQRLEYVTARYGKWMLGLQLRADGDKKVAVELRKHFGTGGSAGVEGIGRQIIDVKADVDRYYVPFDIPFADGKILGVNDYLEVLVTYSNPDYDMAQTGTFDIGILGFMPGTAKVLVQQNPEGDLLRVARHFQYTRHLLWSATGFSMASTYWHMVEMRSAPIYINVPWSYHLANIDFLTARFIQISINNAAAMSVNGWLDARL